MDEYGVLWTATARDDLKSIVDHVAEDSPVAAVRCLDRIEGRCAVLAVLDARRDLSNLLLERLVRR